jgi:hypothetical protein
VLLKGCGLITLFGRNRQRAAMMAHVMMASMVCVAMYPFEVHGCYLCISQEGFLYKTLKPLVKRAAFIRVYTFSGKK